MHPNEEMSTEPGLPTVREVGWVSAFLAVLLFLFFSTPIFRSEILSPADLLLKSEPWRQSAAPEFEPANALLSDYVFQMRPWRSLAISSLKDGQIPLWDPYNYAGAPFWANGQSAVLFPLNLLFLILPDAVGTLLGAMARLFIAGLSAYLFARVIGLRVLGASIAGLGFSFSGFQIVWLLYPVVNVAIWLPAPLSRHRGDRTATDGASNGRSCGHRLHSVSGRPSRNLIAHAVSDLIICMLAGGYDV